MQPPFAHFLIGCNHHTLVDKQPDKYPVGYLRDLKAAHEKWVRNALQIPHSSVDVRLANDLNELKRNAGDITERLCGYGHIATIAQEIYDQIKQVDRMSGVLLEYSEVVQLIRDFTNSAFWFRQRREEGALTGSERKQLVEELTERHHILIKACNQLLGQKDQGITNVGRYDMNGRIIDKKTKLSLFNESGNRCAICGSDVTFNLQLAHIKALYLGGPGKYA